MGDNPFRSRALLEALSRKPEPEKKTEPQPDWWNYYLRRRQSSPSSLAALLKPQTEQKTHAPISSLRHLVRRQTPTYYPFQGSFIKAAAVYVILNAMYEIIYIGETDNLQRRIAQHRYDRLHLMHRHEPSWVRIEFGYENEGLRKARERELIAVHNPPANRCL